MQQTLAATKALADESRLRAFAALLDRDELCGCHIIALLGLAPATVSRHMGLLVDAGLVSSRREGRWVYYRCAESLSPLLRVWLAESWSGSQQVVADRDALDQILACDRTELCACRRTGMPVAGRSQGNTLSKEEFHD